MVGPKEVGKEGMLEKKRARREDDRAFREKGDDGFEADESTLLGGGDSFRDQYVFEYPFVCYFDSDIVLALHDEMQHGNGPRRSVLQGEKTKLLVYANVLQSCGRRTRLQWTCFNS
jgi:hypothetical protein